MISLTLTSMLSALSKNEFILTIVLVIFVMLTAILLLILILLCASKSFRAFFFREAAAKRKKAAQKKKKSVADTSETADSANQPATTANAVVTETAQNEVKPRAARRSKESKMEHELFNTVITVPLGDPAAMQGQASSRTTRERKNDVYGSVPTIAIPKTNSRSEDESTKNTFTVTITRARASAASKATDSAAKRTPAVKNAQSSATSDATSKDGKEPTKKK